jgi:SAM-dependent methyltransferase
MSQTTANPPVPENLKARLKTSYDLIAKTYNEWTTYNSSIRLTYLDHLLDLLPSTSVEPNTTPLRALELGCGAGIPITSTLLSSPRGIPFHVTANDLSSTQITLGKEKLGDDPEKVKWIQGDMTLLEFEENTFDVVIALYSLIHLPREEQKVMMGKIYKFLKPGGVMSGGRGGGGGGGGGGGWSGRGGGAEGSLEMVKGVGVEVVKGEVSPGDGVDASFLWVVGRKPKLGK